MFAHGETVILHRKVTAVENDWGDIEYTSEDVEVHNVAIFPGRSQESSDNAGTLVITPMNVVTQEPIDLDTHDEMTVRGLRYTIQAETSGERVNPFTGTSFGTVIELRRVNG